MTAITIIPQSEITRLDHNPAAVYLASRTSGSRETMAQALKVIAKITMGSPDYLAMPWHNLRYSHTAAIRAELARRYSAPATANKILAALRGVLKTAWKLELMTGEEYYRAVDLDPVKGETIPAGRELTQGEKAAFMAACQADPTPAGARDAAIFAIMYTTGIRREETAAAQLANYDPETGRLIITGKGNKQRTVYILNGAAEALQDWLCLRGDAEGPLFLAVNKSGRIVHRQLAPQSINFMLASREAAAGIKQFSPHDLRRTFVSDLLAAGVDIATVSKMAGHASVTTTARYDRRPEAAKREAANVLFIPYTKRPRQS